MLVVMPASRIGLTMDINKMKTTATLFLMVTTLSAWASDKTPQDVSTFIEHREICDHLRGEIPDPSQVEAMQETLRKIKAYCTGTDATLAKLKMRYKSNPGVMDKLNQYEKSIEIQPK